MEEVKKGESHAISAVAFVEGGIQDACDDACSICLETFSESEPFTLTNCKHEFHLQCVLEWCQRSSNCPMCWQHVSLKDPESQELLEAVEQERSLKHNPARSSAVFYHPTLGNIELSHLPVGISNTELEERIIQHLAVAAMGRAHRVARREQSRNRPSSDECSQDLNNETPQVSSLHSSVNGSQIVGSSSTPIPMLNNSQGISVGSRSSSGQSSKTNEENAGPSDLQSLSDSLKSRFGAMSMKYRESFSKTKRGWRQRLFSRSTSLSNIGSEVRREVNTGINATVSRIMECLETQETNSSSTSEHDNHVNMAAQSESSSSSNNNSAGLTARSD